MLPEQITSINTFNEHFGNKGFDKIVLYGTGINAEAIARHCVECNIVGLMDVAKTGSKMWGFTVLSPEEIVNLGVKAIVVIARPTVHDIIYKRIEAWSVENQITIYDIEGNDIAHKIKAETLDFPYYRCAYQDLLYKIDDSDIVSFDIFDTVLLRHVYEPIDVFTLLDEEIQGKYGFCFSKERVLAEKELRKDKKEPNIYDIYEYMGKKNHLSKEITEAILESEITREKAVLDVRIKIKECIEYCIKNGKKVYFVSDMYLPKGIIADFFVMFGICGYEDILVSCDYNCGKTTGLFNVLMEREPDKKILHIGDNTEADVLAPERYGINSFGILSATKMLEISTYKDTLIYLKDINSRVLIGMLAAKVFNNPFALYESKGKPTVCDTEEFGYLYMAPLIVSFVVWIILNSNYSENGLLLFAARDGWILRELYHKLLAGWDITRNVDDVYFMASRKALEMAQKSKSPEAERYKMYHEAIIKDKYESVFFIDLMSRATCQSKLQGLTGCMLHGLYLQRSYCGDPVKDSMLVNAFYQESSAHGNNRRVFALCDFLECIVTAYEPSFVMFDEQGKMVLEQEKRSPEQLEALKSIHKGIFSYCDRYLKIMSNCPKKIDTVDICDEILRYTSARYSNIGIPIMQEFLLDDWLGGDKNTGKDALA